jgi:glycosyltransferase involved in cell wall biosynthesis
MRINILLSTYNGEKYLADQLNSIINQDFIDWQVIIRDDGSTDGTIAIIADFACRYPSKFLITHDTLGNIGYNKSFTKLFEYITADYIMFCDQDDYWYPHKISLMYSAITEAARKNNHLPLLVFSDLDIADETLTLAKNNTTLIKIHNYKNIGQHVFFLKNYVAGCSIMFNRILVEKTLQTKNFFPVHDL